MHQASHPLLRGAIDAGLDIYKTRCGGQTWDVLILPCPPANRSQLTCTLIASILVQMQLVDPPELVFSADIDSSTTSALPFNFKRQEICPHLC